MAKKSLPGRRGARSASCAGLDLHVTDSTTFEIDTLNVDGYGVPRLNVRAGLVTSTLFFETTDQVQELADSLRAYLRSNEVKRPGAHVSDSERVA